MQTPILLTTSDYIIPQWSGQPSYKFYFQVIKDGCLLNKVDIKRKQFSLVGRLDDLCDIVIDNLTVSRKHAIIQFQKGQDLPFLYDLGNNHGSFVNKQKLPSKVYKKLQLYSNIKFGVSSRYYVLRCPQLQQKQVQAQQVEQNKFLQILQHNHKKLSKQEIKEKYLQMLQNDPYVSVQYKSRKFQGKQTTNQTNSKDQGISWGISDQTQVYRYKNQDEFPIEPDIIRRLPGLDQNMLNKIAQYQDKFRFYDQIQNQINQLNNKQRKEYGLEEKLQNKKEKLQKKFIQSLQALQKCQQWIKTHIFGQQSSYINNKKNKKEKQADTYSDDDFYDRTLQNKKNQFQPQQSIKINTKKTEIFQPTVEDLWELKRKFIQQLTKKKQIMNLKGSYIDQSAGQQRQSIAQQQDELQVYMKQNKTSLLQQANIIYTRQMILIQTCLSQLKSKLISFISLSQISLIQQQILNPQLCISKQQIKLLQKQQQNKHLQQKLKFLQNQTNKRKVKQERIRKIQEGLKGDQDLKLFQLYKEIDQQDQQNYDQDYYNGRTRKIIKHNQYQQSQSQLRSQSQPETYSLPQECVNNEQAISSQQQPIIDLTSRFK